MASLAFTAGPAAGRLHALAGPEVVIGRGSEAQIALPDPYASRRHAAVYREAGRWLVEDLGSRAGTYLNGARLDRPTVLADGDELRFARSACRVDLTAGEASEAGRELAIADPDPSRLYVSGAAPGDSDPLARDPGRAIRLFERKIRALRGILGVMPQSDREETIGRVADELLAAFPQARAACVLLPAEDGGELAPRAVRRREGDEEARAGASRPEIPRALVDRAAAGDSGVLFSDPRADARGHADAADGDEPAGGRMAAPVPGHAGSLGVLYVEAPGPVLGREDVDLLASIAAHVGLALEAGQMREELFRRHQLERDLRVARQIQASLLPGPEAGRRGGLDTAVHYAPAYEVGGDFYDFIWQGPSRVAVVVGDVAGKAVSAALYMARLTSELRSRAALGPAPSDLLAQVNEAMCALGDGGMFATLVYADLDLERRELRFVNAGHVAPLLRRGEDVRPVHAERAHAPPVGVLPGVAAGEARVALQPGDRLLFATDGIHEARDAAGGEYGLGRLAKTFAAAGAAPSEIVADVLADVCAHLERGAQGDDITLLALSVAEPCPPRGRMA